MFLFCLSPLPFPLSLPFPFPYPSPYPSPTFSPLPPLSPSLLIGRDQYLFCFNTVQEYQTRLTNIQTSIDF